MAFSRFFGFVTKSTFDSAMKKVSVEINALKLKDAELQAQIDDLKEPDEPQEQTLTLVNYNVPNPTYLQGFEDENFGNTLLKISEDAQFGGNRLEVRHAYSKRQVWNADGSMIALAGNSPYLLDGNTGEILGTASGFGNMGWSNTDPLITYQTSSGSNYFQIKRMNPTTYRSDGIFTKRFYDYNVMSHWGNESNVSKDDKIVALYGTKSGSVNCWVLVYDIENEKIISEKNLGISRTSVNWVSVSQSGLYVVVQFNQIGTSNSRGTWLFDQNLNRLRQLTDRTPHGDLGYDINGNEVWVSNDMNQIRSQRLEGFGSEIEYAYVSGGHVSCRNVNLPGWALVNDHGASSTNTYPSFREVFYVKLDEKETGETLVRRMTKHYSNTNQGYYNQPHAVASRNGDRCLFASNMEATNKTYANVYMTK